jgi:KaiC/GvpD/RAD55 family RecA-like ATPase
MVYTRERQAYTSWQEKTDMSAAECKNPFCLEPIQLQAQFFGRESETRNTLNFMHNGQCVSVVGPARIGKTSFLFHVAHPHVRAIRKRAEEQVFVHLDSHALANLEEGECYVYIREETIRQIKSEVAVDKGIGVQLEKLVRQAGSQTAYFGLRTLLQSARELDLKLVIVLDHLDVLNQNRHLREVFFSALRSLHTNYAIAYLVASRSPIDRLERICPDGPGSPFFNIFQQISIGLLTDEESRQMVAALPGMANATFPESVVDCILEMGRNEPHRLQRAGYSAFEIWQENQQEWLEKHCKEIRRRFDKIKT